MVALVDDSDFDFLSQWKWCVGRGDDKWYAKRTITINGKPTCMLMHRQIMEANPGQQIDHRDRNGLNNQRSNLRFCNQSQNIGNSPTRSKNTSGFKGVTYYKPKKNWQAQITFNGHNYYLGRFDTPAKAAIVYDSAAVIKWGEFALTNKMLGLL